MSKELQTLLLKIDERLSGLEEQIKAIQDELQINSINRKSRKVWTEKQIAHYLRLSYGYVVSNIITLEDFPKPIDYGSTGQKRHRRYLSGEVIAYFEDAERTKQTRRIIQKRTQQDINELMLQARRNAIKSLRGFTGI